MKRLTLLILLFVGTFALQQLVTCSKPLESRTDPDLEPPEPIIITDTFFDFDTVYLSSSDSCIDTVIISDTVIVTDTVFIPEDTIYQDTLIISDTIVIFDIDTIIITDTIFEFDTVFIPDTTIFDTIYITDTVDIGDTVIIHDTITETDTVNIGDTITLYDTIIITDTILDTLIFTDTVIVFIPDTTGVQTECSRLSSHQHNLVWMFQNQAGNYSIRFSSNIESNNPIRDLLVNIGGHNYSWNPHESGEFIVELYLGNNVTIKVGLDQPKAFGHPVDICVSLDPL